MMDIRIVGEVTLQPTLFGEPIKETVFRLVEWETNEPVSSVCYSSIAEAERASVAVLRPSLSKRTEDYAESDQGER